ncbi:MAG: ABC transporter ATP-binding protein [Candidatus Methylumidiphilus sp.]
MTIAIRAENLGKRFVINHEQQGQRFRYATLGETLTNAGQTLRRRLRHPFAASSHSSATQEEFWALKDINFEIQQGERIGIIGSNGAGKSTLLKILSRISPPTTGKVTIKGRVASLLEVGTGFHPELTGRENIFLNGAILGMRSHEIAHKFDEIVAFAEVDKFLDTPVKHYSSGMYVRLAFAVAAHLEPEILIVDEVLAVGDVQFQKKCLGKMEDVANSGRTILLVSHNLPTIQSLSDKVLFFAGGELIELGVASQVIHTYQETYRGNSLYQTDLTAAEHYGNGWAEFRSIQCFPLDSFGKRLPGPVTGCDILFSITIFSYKNISNITIDLTIYDDFGSRLIDASTLCKGDSANLMEGRATEVRFTLKNVRLKPNVYTVGLWMGAINQFDIDGVRYATLFKIEAKHEDILYSPPFPGVYSCEFEHEILW